MANKIDSGIVSNFKLGIEGNNVVISYRGKECMRFNLKLISVAHKDLGVYLGEIEGKIKEQEGQASAGQVPFTAAEVERFIQSYQGLQRKYTGKFSRYPVGGRYYSCFERAVVQAKENDLEFEDYIQLLINHFSRRNAGAQVAFPYPNQIAGEYAQQVIIDETGRSSAKKIPDEMRAQKLAQTNRYLSVDKDQAFQDAYYRVKAKKATRFDFEYMKARQTQLLGEPKDWLLKREAEFNKEEKQDGEE